MFCVKCSLKLPKKSSFCYFCGTNQHTGLPDPRMPVVKGLAPEYFFAKLSAEAPKFKVQITAEQRTILWTQVFTMLLGIGVYGAALLLFYTYVPPARWFTFVVIALTLPLLLWSLSRTLRELAAGVAIEQHHTIVKLHNSIHAVNTRQVSRARAVAVFKAELENQHCIELTRWQFSQLEEGKRCAFVYTPKWYRLIDVRLLD